MKPARLYHRFSVQAKSISIQGTESTMIAESSRALFIGVSNTSKTHQLGPQSKGELEASGLQRSSASFRSQVSSLYRKCDILSVAIFVD